MEMLEQEDVKVLWTLGGLQKALCFSSMAPFLLRNFEDVAVPGVSNPAVLHYRANKKHGEHVMRQRLEDFGGDIDKHLEIHRDCVNGFLAMDYAILEDSRSKFYGAFIPVSDRMHQYAELLRNHLLVAKKRSFLFPPASQLGHYMTIQDKIFPLAFNINMDWRGFVESVDCLDSIMLDFSTRIGPLLVLDNSCDSAGFYDQKFQEHLKEAYAAVGELRKS